MGTQEMEREAPLEKYRQERDKRLRADGNEQYDFRDIDEWRTSGDFTGLELRSSRAATPTP